MRNLLSICFMCLSFTVSVKATTFVPEARSAVWISRTYSTVLPEPFGAVKVDVEIDEKKKIESFVVEVKGKVVLIQREAYAGLSEPSEIYIGYADPKMMKSGEVDYIQLIFEFGELRHYDNCKGIEKEGKYCYFGNEKDARVITITKNFEVSAKTSSTADILNNATP